jgi:aspartyl aminopeptidase
MMSEFAWKKYDEKELETVMKFSDDYMDFLSNSKTERACVKNAIALAKKNGYVDIKDVIKNKTILKPQDKVYVNMMNKSLAFMHIGQNNLEEGMNILGAHIDSPRLDLKQNPLYEDGNIAYLDTHYYGGVKKYQWVTIPLAIHGVVVLKDGTTLDIAIGDKEDDPVFVISDLLIHLSGDQLQKKASSVIDGEDLNVTVGSIPLDGEEKDAVKANVVKLLKSNYGFDEEDFVSAELEVVPAGRARSCGFDSSMVLGYGHDDRVCAYTSLVAQLEAKDLKRTGVCLLVDKEEVGSIGATGMQSRFFETFVAEVLNAMGQYSELAVKRAMANSTMLSSDVAAAHDPIYASASSPRNQAEFGKGVVFAKYTGARGKSACNDANAEFMALIRNVMDTNNVSWQTSELGKVDQGGGGTIAYILAQYGMQVIDCGVALHNMHAPNELASKADIYEAYKCYEAFLKYKG